MSLLAAQRVGLFQDSAALRSPTWAAKANASTASGGKHLLAAQRRLLPLVASFQSLTRYLARLFFGCLEFVEIEQQIYHLVLYVGATAFVVVYEYGESQWIAATVFAVTYVTAYARYVSAFCF